MDKLIIKGGSKISGSVNVHGSKNAALPIIVSSLLSDKILKLSNVILLYGCQIYKIKYLN